MPSLFLTVLQTTLACTQLAGAAADDHGAVVVDLTLVDRAGAPFTGPLSLRLRQRAPGTDEEWSSHAIEFDSTGRLEQAVVGLGAVDPGWAIWARVERNARGFVVGPDTVNFHGDDESPCRGTVSLRLPAVTAGTSGPPRLGGTIVVEETPVYAEVRVLGASTDAPYRICTWIPWSRELGMTEDLLERHSIDAAPAPEATVVRSLSEASSTRFHVIDADGRLVHTGALARGSLVEVDPSRVGHVLVDPGPGRHRVFVVPRSAYAPPTERERANGLAKHMRLGRLKPYECWFDAPRSSFLAECLAPGAHVVEVWREGGSDVPPFAPGHVAEVVVRGGEALRYDVP